jgi:drug/metabolite transporter (DMT)-like permease
MSVEHMVLYRFLFACLGMLPVLMLNRIRFTRAELRLLMVSATFGVPVQFLLQFHGLARTTVSHAALMVGCMPVLLAAAAALFAGERLDRVGWVALFASTAGAALIVLGGSRGPAAHGQPFLIGDLMVVASLCTALAWILVSKKLMLTHSPPAVTASGLACTATTTLLWNWGIHHVPASRAGVFLNIEPALGSFLGVKFLGEHLGPFAWIGGALILGAAITLTTRGHEAEPAVILE